MKKNKGSLTLEAALIMPLVIYMVFLMISMSLYIYTRVHVAISINNVSTVASAQWYSIGSEFDVSNAASITGNAIGTSLSGNKKIEVLKSMLERRINKGTPIKVISEISADRVNYLVGEKVILNVNCTYNPPLKGIYKFFGATEETFKSNYVKVIKLSNNESNMRTVSYVKDLIGRVKDDVKEALDNFENALKGVGDKQ